MRVRAALHPSFVLKFAAIHDNTVVNSRTGAQNMGKKGWTMKTAEEVSNLCFDFHSAGRGGGRLHVGPDPGAPAPPHPNPTFGPPNLHQLAAIGNSQSGGQQRLQVLFGLK